MSEPLESELAGVGVDAPHQADFPLGDVRHHPEAPGDLHLGQAAAAPTYGELQVASEDLLINSEFEAGGGEALQASAPSGPQTAPTATADGVVGVHLQHIQSVLCAALIGAFDTTFSLDQIYLLENDCHISLEQTHAVLNADMFSIACCGFVKFHTHFKLRLLTARH
jgi:hypothetical protein